jgi:branched-chain amino acid transport system ATP-binding protein
MSMLRVENLTSGYGRIAVLRDVSLDIAKGEMVALVGSNGAGKTTLLRAISGVQPITGGAIVFDGRPIHALSPHARVRAGIVQVPEGRQVFAPLAVADNLRLGAWTRSDGDITRDLDEVYATFPALAEKRAIASGALSGGQQQMLAIGRALMARPKLLLLDEPSMGLAPMLAAQILANVAALKARGLTVLLVEQRAHAALAIADRAYVLETGRITLSGDSAALREDARVREAYLGL